MEEISFRNDILPLKDKLYRLALRITMNAAEAEDIVQDTLIRVWNKRDEWSNFGSLEAFCIVVARNLAIDRSQRKEVQNISLTYDLEDALQSAGPYDILVNKEKLKLVHKLINDLPEQQRLIIQLRDVEGESYKRIAEILSLSEEQVKVYLYRARQKVKQRYKEIDDYGL